MSRILSNILNEILAIYSVNSFNFRLMFFVQSCITTKLTLYISFVFYFWQIEHFAKWSRVSHSPRFRMTIIAVNWWEFQESQI